MKFQARAGDLQHIFTIAQKGKPTTQLVTLNRLLVEALPEGTVRFTRSNGSLFVSAWCEADVEKSGEWLFEPEKVEALLNVTAPEVMVSVKQERKPGQNVRGRVLWKATDEAKLLIQSVEYFPQIKFGEVEGSMHIDSDQRKTLFVSAGKVALQSAQNVSINPVDGVLCMVSDNVRTSVVQTDGKDAQPCLVPIRFLKVVMDATGSEVLEFSGSKARMRGEDCEATFVLTEGKPWSPEPYLQDTFEVVAKLVVDPQIKNFLTTAVAFCDDGDAIRFIYDDGKAHIETTGENAYTSRKFLATPTEDYAGFECAYNPIYLRAIADDLGDGTLWEFLLHPKYGDMPWIRAEKAGRIQIVIPVTMRRRI